MATSEFSNEDASFPAEHKDYMEMMQVLRAYQVAVNQAAIVSITDTKGNIIYVNEKFVQISKYSAKELIGNNHRLINSGYHSKEYFLNMWQDISSGKSWRGEIRNRAKDGSLYWVDTVITPIIDRKGKIFQYLSIRNLITPQKENEERLLQVQREMKRRKKLLTDAQKVAKTGSWYLKVEGDNRLEWSEETYRIFEIEPGTPMTYERFLESVHPEDRQIVETKWIQALQTTGMYHVEHRINTKSGNKWVSERAHMEFDEAADLKGALGTVQDITEKKRIEESLRESENLYKTLFNNSPFVIGIVDKRSHKFLEVNETAVKLYGYSIEEFREMTLYDIRVSEEHEQLTKLLKQGHYTNDRSVRTHRKKSGEIIYIEPSITSIIYKGSDVYLITINDVTKKILAERELELAEQKIQKGIIEAEEKSRSYIGMELHDNVNQLLVTSLIYLQRVETSSEKGISSLKTAEGIIKNALEEIRKLSASLVTPILSNNSLTGSIEDLAKNYALLYADIHFETNVHVIEDEIQQTFKINVYRIIQEQLSNIIKHAEATSIKLTLLQHDKFMELEIADNGKGFDVVLPKKGIGLKNIIHRAEAYGGVISITSGVNEGCKVKIQFDIALVKT